MLLQIPSMARTSLIRRNWGSSADIRQHPEHWIGCLGVPGPRMLGFLRCRRVPVGEQDRKVIGPLECWGGCLRSRQPRLSIGGFCLFNKEVKIYLVPKGLLVAVSGNCVFNFRRVPASSVDTVISQYNIVDQQKRCSNRLVTVQT